MDRPRQKLRPFVEALQPFSFVKYLTEGSAFPGHFPIHSKSVTPDIWLLGIFGPLILSTQITHV